jgi:hypothetical protein
MEQKNLPTVAEINTLKSEHLTNGEKPIIACVEGYDDIPLNSGEDEPETVRDVILRAKEEGKYEAADYDKDRVLAKEDGFLNGSGYSISPLTFNAKLSSGFIMCTGVLGVGKDKATGKNISFLSHQFPGSFLSKEIARGQYRHDLKIRLAELRKTSISGSVDIVIVGGEYNKNDPTFEAEYEESIGVLKRAVSEEFGFEPVVITGPKLFVPGKDDEDVFFDTEHRRLFISRPEVGDDSTESYLPKDVLKQKEKWKRVSKIHLGSQ